MANNTHKVKYAEVKAYKLVTIKQQEAVNQIQYWPDWYKDLFVTGRLYWNRNGFLQVKHSLTKDDEPEFGSWLVLHSDGRIEVMSRTAFEMRYESVEIYKPQQQLDLPEIN